MKEHSKSVGITVGNVHIGINPQIAEGIFATELTLLGKVDTLGDVTPQQQEYLRLLSLFINGCFLSLNTLVQLPPEVRETLGVDIDTKKVLAQSKLDPITKITDTITFAVSESGKPLGIAPKGEPPTPIQSITGTTPLPTDPTQFGLQYALNGVWYMETDNEALLSGVRELLEVNNVEFMEVYNYLPVTGLLFKINMRDFRVVYLKERTIFNQIKGCNQYYFFIALTEEHAFKYVIDPLTETTPEQWTELNTFLQKKNHSNDIDGIIAEIFDEVVSDNKFSTNKRLVNMLHPCFGSEQLGEGE